MNYAHVTKLMGVTSGPEIVTFAPPFLKSGYAPDTLAARICAEGYLLCTIYALHRNETVVYRVYGTGTRWRHYNYVIGLFLFHNPGVYYTVL